MPDTQDTFRECVAHVVDRYRHKRSEHRCPEFPHFLRAFIESIAKHDQLRSTQWFSARDPIARRMACVDSARNALLDANVRVRRELESDVGPMIPSRKSLHHRTIARSGPTRRREGPPHEKSAKKIRQMRRTRNRQMESRVRSNNRRLGSHALCRYPASRTAWPWNWTDALMSARVVREPAFGGQTASRHKPPPRSDVGSTASRHGPHPQGRHRGRECRKSPSVGHVRRDSCPVSQSLSVSSPLRRRLDARHLFRTSSSRKHLHRRFDGSPETRITATPASVNPHCARPYALLSLTPPPPHAERHRDLPPRRARGRRRVPRLVKGAARHGQGEQESKYEGKHDGGHEG